jgi:hypothetical protein
VGSIPDEVIEYDQLTQPLTEMSARNLLGRGVKVRAVHKADSLTIIYELIVK